MVTRLSFSQDSKKSAKLVKGNCVCFIQVDALQGHRVIDVACGSGDAQTLCLTDDDMVWSWGDGDYGKLGRGGSDGCKIPMKVRRITEQCVLEVNRGISYTSVF